MSPQKVIDIMDRIIDEDWHVYTDDAIEALKIASARMEKDIPKPVIKIDIPLLFDDQEGVYPEYHCPNGLCNKRLHPLYESKRVKMTYCPWCGQQIDWEENDEGV